MIELHRKLMGDRGRNTAFYQALKKVIKPGKSVVLDVGAGTGFLSFLARQLGAKESVLIESGEVLPLAKKLAQLNKVSGLKFFPNHSSKFSMKSKADVIVSETLGSIAMEENLIENINSVRNLLAPSGHVIPSRLREWVQPVVTPKIHRDIDVWGGVGYDLDFAPARETTLNNLYVRQISSDDLLSGDPACWDDVDLSKKASAARKGSAAWNITRETTVYGFCMWWEATLAEGVVLSTSPFAPPTHWEQVYMPCLEPLTLTEGESVALDIHSDSRYSVGIRIKWTITARSRDKQPRATQSLDMKRGQL
jgi:protein arginine N-methyltransferase 1